MFCNDVTEREKPNTSILFALEFFVRVCTKFKNKKKRRTQFIYVCSSLKCWWTTTNIWNKLFFFCLAAHFYFEWCKMHYKNKPTTNVFHLQMKNMKLNWTWEWKKKKGSIVSITDKIEHLRQYNMCGCAGVRLKLDFRFVRFNHVTNGDVIKRLHTKLKCSTIQMHMLNNKKLWE